MYVMSKNKKNITIFHLKIVNLYSYKNHSIYEPRCEKTGLQGFRPGPIQTRLCNHRRWLVARNFGFGKKRDCTIYVAKTKALISFAVTAKLI